VADNSVLDAGSGGDTIVTREISHGGDTAKLQGVFAMGISGNEGSYTAAAIGGDATNGLDVDVTRSALPTGASTSAKQDTAQTALDAIAASVAGTLTVGGNVDIASIAAGDNNIGNVDLASAIPAGTNNIGDVDVLSVVPGTAATNLGKAEDAAHTSGDVGVMALFVRQDSQSDFGADGDYVPGSIDGDGALRVAIVSGAGSGGTAVADDADFTDGTTSLTPIGGVYESTPSSVTDGDIGMAGITSTRALRVAIDSGGVAGRAEDSAHSSGHEGIVMLAVRRDSAAVGSDTDGDYSTINVNSAGRVYTSSTIDAALPAGTNAIGKLAANSGVDIGDVDVTSLPNVTLAAGTNTNEVVGDVAHDAAAAGNPVQTGGYATNNIEGVTQVAAGDLTRTVHDLNGVQVVRPHTTLEEIQSVRTTNTDGNSTSLVAAAGSGVHNYLSAITIWNSSSTDGFVDLRDGTAGSVLYTVPAPQTGGAHIPFPVPLKFGDNTAIAFDVSGAISTIYISAVFFQAQG
jgi:hypothetical protein